jgi:hypothetical protein
MDSEFCFFQMNSRPARCPAAMIAIAMSSRRRGERVSFIFTIQQRFNFYGYGPVMECVFLWPGICLSIAIGVKG